MSRTKEKNEILISVFTFLMQRNIRKDFVFPSGRLTVKTMTSCMESLEKIYGWPSRERLTDYCICQVHVISNLPDSYIRRWNIRHSFGVKAVLRYRNNDSASHRQENYWLKKNGLSRAVLYEQFKCKKEHPLAKLIYPEYEEVTKRRMHSSEVGFYLCQLSTLLWTPFSQSCRTCRNEARCKEVTEAKYGELYRIRISEYSKNRKI